MRVDIIRREEHFEARISDKLCFADSAAFRKLIDEVKTSGCKTCTFDLKGLEAVDSAGLGMMMIAIDNAKRNGWSLSVKNAQGAVLKLFQLSRMDKLLNAA